MRTILLFLLVFGCTISVFCQKKIQPLCYKISKETYLYYKKNPKPDTSFLSQLFTTPNTSCFSPDLKYYVKVLPQQEDLNVHFIANTSLSLYMIPHPHELLLKVLDPAGQPIEHPEVSLKGTVLPFNKQLDAFQLKTWNPKSHQEIKVKTKQEVAFFDLKASTNNYNRDQQKTKDGVFVWLARSGRKTWDHARRLFQTKLIQNNSHIYNGYIAFSQPKFRPNDTLKVKGYFLSKKGKPFKEPLQVHLLQGSTDKWSSNITPIEPGAYTLELPLEDSLHLSLDQQYTIVFKHKGRKLKQHSFRYEDYQLDEVAYSLISDKASYQHGDKIMLKLAGQYTTGHRIADGEVELLVRAAPYSYFSPSSFYGNTAEIKDTLHCLQQTLSPDEATQIIIPTDSFPKAELSLRVVANFKNSNGELQQKELDIQLQKPISKSKQTNSNPLQLTLDGAYVKAYTTALSKNDFSTMKWDMDLDFDKGTPTKNVLLPYQERVNGFASYYEVCDENNCAELDMEEQLHEVVFKGERHKNKIHLQLENPRQLPVYYQLFKGKKMLLNQLTDQAAYQLKLPTDRNATYYLKYQFHWANEQVMQEETFLPIHQILNVAIEQPHIIQPGSTIPIKINVTNYKNQRQSNVNLTAGAVNTQFEQRVSFSDLKMKHKRTESAQPIVRHKYSHLFKAPALTLKYPLRKEWLAKTKADSLLYYQIRMPDKGSWQHYEPIPTYDTWGKEIAQFAPFIMKMGRSQPIYLIYCNERLVYYYDIDKDAPYSFVGEEGENKITIRTIDHSYEAIVNLEKGKKLIFSIDALQYSNPENPMKVTRSWATPAFTSSEKNLIKNNILVLQSLFGEYYLYQEGQPTQSITTYNSHKFEKAGPFQPGAPIQLKVKNGFQKKLFIEKGFSQKIEENKDYYYEYPWKELKRALPRTLPLKGVKDRVTMIRNFPTPPSPKVKRINNPSIQYDNPQRRLEGLPSGKVMFYTKTPRKDISAILWKPSPEFTYTYHPTITSFFDQPGDYQLVVLHKDSTYRLAQIALHQNTLQYVNMDALPLQRDSALWYFQQIGKTPAKVLKEKEWEAYKRTLGEGSTRTVSGIVRDYVGEVLIGASVIAKGTQIGTITDIDGRFTLTFPENAILEISYTGYSSEELRVPKNQSNISINLLEGLQLLEVVVVGYGAATSKHSFTSSATIISSKDEVATTIPSKTDKNNSEKTALLKEVSAFNFTKDALRTNFSDHGFWMPNITTDWRGEAYFMATFPDNFTKWETFAIGMNRKGKVGACFSNTSAFKPLIGQLVVPRFLLEGDSVAMIGKALNFTDDLLAIQTAFKENTTTLQSNTAPLGATFIESTFVKAPPAIDSLTYTYQVQSQEFADAEKRSIPIFKKGIEEHEGSFHMLEGDTTLSLSFTDTQTPVTLRIESNIVDLLKGNIDNLIHYPHGCNEQTSSKLLATLLAKKLLMAKGAYFDKESYITYGVKRLTNSQNKDGSWGWWKGGKPNVWMTAYVINALHKAQLAGYSTPAYELGINYLVTHFPGQKGRHLLDILHLFSTIGQSVNFEKWLTVVESTADRPSLNMRLTLLKIRQAQGLPFDLKELIQTQQQDLFKQVYWKGDYYHWYNTRFQNTLLAYQILRKAGEDAICSSIERYLIRQRKRYGWGNTFQTAKVTATILDYYLKDNLLRPHSNLFLAIGDQQLIEVNSFPFEKTVPAHQAIRIINKNKGTVYCSAKQTYFNDTPTPKAEYFEVSTSFWQDDKRTDTLQQGVSTDLLVEVTVNRDAEYVMIEVPIPGGCSYGDKDPTLHRNKYNNKEVHRAHYREKAAIFCEELTEGKYQYRIPLEPRFEGKFTLNPAKVEEMYFPVFYGRNNSKVITIRK